MSTTLTNYDGSIVTTPQDGRLLGDAAVGSLRLHVLGVTAPGLGDQPEGPHFRQHGFRCSMPLGSYFLTLFNDWAFRHGGTSPLNQSPFVKKEHVVAAYGDRWKKLSDYVRTADPTDGLLNPFFQELLT